MTTILDVIAFLKEETHANVQEISEVSKDLGVDGDDFAELMEAYAAKYSVDMSGYLWYFHHGEEGINFPGALFFKPPYFRVKTIPITPKMLADFANQGKWAVDYPKHKIPEKRVDLLINKIFVGLVVLMLVLTLIKKYL